MPAEEIRLVLDDRRGSYRPGESVSGHVEVTASAAEAGGPTAVTVGLWWEARGAGDTDRGSVHEVEIATRPAVGGGRYPFSIPAPPGPWSYDGNVFRVEWLLEARIGRGGSTSTQVPIPSDAPATFQSKHHMVTWELRVAIVPKGCPRLEERLKLVVHPKGRS